MRRQVGPSPRSTLLPTTATVLVLLGLTLWLTSFGKLRVTITKPADTDPPYTIRKGELLEVEGIVDDGGNIYFRPEVIQIRCFSKNTLGTGGEVVHWNISVFFDRVTQRFRGRFPPPIVPGESTYITASGTQARSGATFSRSHRNLVCNVVRVCVE
jgi:hypothetical protein